MICLKKITYKKYRFVTSRFINEKIFQQYMPLKKKKKKVSFWTTKNVTKPQRVEFMNKYGELVSFKAKKTIKKPVKVTFFTDTKKKKNVRKKN